MNERRQGEIQPGKGQSTDRAPSPEQAIGELDPEDVADRLLYIEDGKGRQRFILEWFEKHEAPIEKEELLDIADNAFDNVEMKALIRDLIDVGNEIYASEREIQQRSDAVLKCKAALLNNEIGKLESNNPEYPLLKAELKKLDEKSQDSRITDKLAEMKRCYDRTIFHELFSQASTELFEMTDQDEDIKEEVKKSLAPSLDSGNISEIIQLAFQIRFHLEREIHTIHGARDDDILNEVSSNDFEDVSNELYNQITRINKLIHILQTIASKGGIVYHDIHAGDPYNMERQVAEGTLQNMHPFELRQFHEHVNKHGAGELIFVGHQEIDPETQELSPTDTSCKTRLVLSETLLKKR